MHTWAIPLRDKHGSIIGIIQTFEGEFAVAGPDPNDRSMKERGCLDDATGLPNQAMMQSHLRKRWARSPIFRFPLASFCVEAHELSQFRPRYGQEAATSILQRPGSNLEKYSVANRFRRPLERQPISS